MRGDLDAAIGLDGLLFLDGQIRALGLSLLFLHKILDAVWLDLRLSAVDIQTVDGGLEELLEMLASPFHEPIEERRRQETLS